jgi:hypothetical protein
MIAFIIKDYLLNSFSQLVPIALSVIAILISVVGLYLSNRANKKSSRIQELQTRPWLNATINNKCNPNESYYDFHIYEDVQKIGFAVSVCIKNIGSSPANNIHIKLDVFIKDFMFETGELEQEKIFVLSQDREYYIKKIKILKTLDPQLFKNLCKDLNENKIKIKTIIKINYSGLINNNNYETEVNYLISKREYWYDGTAKYT